MGAIAIATVVAGLAVESLDFGFLCLTRWLRDKPVREAVRVLLPVTLLSVPLYAPLVALLATTYSQISPWTLPLFLVPALAAQKLFGLYRISVGSLAILGSRTSVLRRRTSHSRQRWWRH